jgi:hypothetical protein
LAAVPRDLVPLPPIIKKIIDGKEQYRVEISNRFAAVENIDSEVTSGGLL